MTEQAKLAKKEYQRQYKKKWYAKPENRAKQRAYEEKYWNKKGEELTKDKTCSNF